MTMTGWIPVTLRLPDTGMYGISDTVLVAYTIAGSPLLVGIGAYHNRDSMWNLKLRASLHLPVVRYWMELPEPPEPLHHDAASHT